LDKSLSDINKIYNLTEFESLIYVSKIIQKCNLYIKLAVSNKVSTTTDFMSV